MKKLVKITILIPLISLLVLIVVGIVYHLWETRFSEPTGKGRWSTTSPDGRFTVTGYLTKGLGVLIPTMPGDGGYGDGIVILRDNKTGKVLQKARVENVSNLAGLVDWMVGEPDADWRINLAILKGTDKKWEGNYVYVQYVDTWPLPDEEGKLPPPWPKFRTYPSPQ
jgi:hypothetical protein